MKTYLAGLQASTQTTYSNNGKTTLLGRAMQRTINSQSVLGPIPTQFIDVQTTVGIAPQLSYYNPNTGRLYVVNTAGALVTVVLYNFNNTTGAYSYVGKIIMNMPNAAAATYTLKGFAVYESGGLIYPIVSASSSVVINGGTFVAWGIPVASFTVGGTQIFAASGSGQQAVYFYQDSLLYGQNNTVTTTWGLGLPQFSTGYAFTITSANATAGATYTNNSQTFTVQSTIASATTLVMSSSTGAPTASGTLTLATGTGSATITFSAASPVASKVWQFNGTLAAAQLFEWDLNITPTVANILAPGAITAQTSTYANTAPVAYFTQGSSNNGFNLTNGDIVVLTGTVPTAFTAWTPGTLQVAGTNVYFVRDLQQQFAITIPALPNQYTFTTTATGAAIVPGAQFTNNSQTFTIPTAYGSGVTTVVGQASAAPLASGTLTAVGSQYAFTATATPSGISSGATYTNNSQTFTATASFSPGVTSFAFTGTGAPTASGTLTLATGTGPATITYSASSSTVGPATVTFSANAAVTGITANATYTYTNNGATYTFTLPTAVSAAATSFTATTLTGNPAPAVVGTAGQLALTGGTGPAVVSFTNSVGGNWFLNLGTTTGGALVAPTSAGSSFGVMRAFGTSNNALVLKTAPMATTLTLGALITNQTVGWCKPASTPANTSLQGNDCLYLGTSTGLYMGLISDLSTNGYTFTIASSSVTAGAVYMNNNQYFTVRSSIASATALSCTSTGAPQASGYLVLVSGTGPATIAFSAFTQNGATWASVNFAGVNITGTGIDIIVPSSTQTVYVNQGFPYDIDKFIYSTGISSFVAKPFQASLISLNWGAQSNVYMETLNPTTIQCGFNALSSINCVNGWFFAVGGTASVGQRGVLFADLASDATFGLTGIVSPVLNVPGATAGAVLKYLMPLEQLFQNTNNMNFWIRSATTSTDASFSSVILPTGEPLTVGSVSSGWTSIQTAMDLSAVAIGPYFQLLVTFDVATIVANAPPEATTPAQLFDLAYTITPTNEISDYWTGSVDNTTGNGVSPAYTSFRLTQPYASTVPTLYFRAYDDSGNLVASANTVTNPTLFNYTTNNGTSWNSLGTIPNTTLTTEVRYQWATPAGVRVNCSLRES